MQRSFLINFPIVTYVNVFNCFLTFEILLFKFQYIARCYDEALIISTLHRYRNLGNFYVKIIHVINIHFD